MTTAGASPGRTALRSVGILFRDSAEGAVQMAHALESRLRDGGYAVWAAPLVAGEISPLGQLPGTDVALVLGGDGSILSAARLCAPMGIPLLGVNFGRVGFLTELEPSEVETKLGRYLEGDYWVDERSMLEAEFPLGGQRCTESALNDVVLVRGAAPRVVRIKVWLDGHYYNTTVADGIIVSTATGSTAYNLAAGGPILHPQVRSSVLTPIAAHLAAGRSLILEPRAVVTLEIQDDSDTATLSADGQINHQILPGTQVTVTTNAHVTRFLRRRPPTHFYRILSAKLRDEF